MPSASMARAAAASPSATASCTASTIIEGTLAKAFGVMGGYIAGSAALAATSSAASPRASSSPPSLPPAIAAGALASDPPSEGERRRARSASRSASRTRAAPARRGSASRCCDNPSHIVPVMVGDPVQLQGDQRHAAGRTTASMCSRSTIRPCRAAPSGCASRRRRCIPTPTSTIWSARSRSCGPLPGRQGRICEARRRVGGTSQSQLVAARAISAVARYCSDALPWRRATRGRFAATALRGLAARPGLCGGR